MKMTKKIMRMNQMKMIMKVIPICHNHKITMMMMMMMKMEKITGIRMAIKLY